jgi:two-component system, chemotaxis family, response regulator PixG
MHVTMAEDSLSLISIEDFSGAKQTTFFKLLKQPRFSGELYLSDLKGQTWVFHIYMGRLTFAMGGVHSFRSWKRNVLAQCPDLAPFAALFKQALQDAADRDLSHYWQYHILCLWVEQKKITREQVAKIVRSLMVEALFDITQARQVTYQVKQSSSSTQLGMQLAYLTLSRWPPKLKSYGRRGKLPKSQTALPTPPPSFVSPASSRPTPRPISIRC